ncbi:MAG TPA: energy transducer TonB, partial [Acidobacteriaceae bacterium]
MKTVLLFLVLSTAAFAQTNTCGGLTSVTDGAQPVYPPIAKAAHVEGVVTLLVSFKNTGEADTVQIVSGPPMLQQA